MQVDFSIDSKDYFAFEQFMTKELEEGVHRAYAQTLYELARGCAASIEKRLGRSQDSDDRALYGAGIGYAPRTIKRILQLEPMRAVVGAGSTRERNFTKSMLVGSPFRVSLTVKKGKSTLKRDLMAQRNKNSVHVDRDTATSPRHISGTNIRYQSHQSFRSYRNTALPITIISPIELADKQAARFKSMVDEYMEANHDRVFERKHKAAVERLSK